METQRPRQWLGGGRHPQASRQEIVALGGHGVYGTRRGRAYQSTVMPILGLKRRGVPHNGCRLMPRRATRGLEMPNSFWTGRLGLRLSSNHQKP